MSNRFKADIYLNEEQKRSPNLLGYASLTYDNTIKIDGFEVWQHKDPAEGKFVRPPQKSYKHTGDKFPDKVYANNREVRDEIEAAIIEEYNSVINRQTDYSIAVRAFKNPRGSSLAWADVTFNGEITVCDFQISQGKNGPKVRFPDNGYTIDHDGKKEYHSKEVCHSVSPGLTPELTKAILEVYEKDLAAGKFEQDYIQQKDSEPVTLISPEKEREAATDKDAAKEVEQRLSQGDEFESEI
jgi:DNA-binding cell septation regulator SpoVG